MRGRYFRDISIVRAGGENNVPLPEADEVVVYRSFMKAGLRFPLDRLLVEVLKTFEIYLYQLTPEAIIKMGIFIWAMRSQGLEPNAKCFCNIHELSYETKATGKEQYHNNFSCYNFMPRSEASYPVPTFQRCTHTRILLPRSSSETALDPNAHHTWVTGVACRMVATG
jgi:hypothetical protein